MVVRGERVAKRLENVREERRRRAFGAQERANVHVARRVHHGADAAPRFRGERGEDGPRRRDDGDGGVFRGGGGGVRRIGRIRDGRKLEEPNGGRDESNLRGDESRPRLIGIRAGFRRDPARPFRRRRRQSLSELGGDRRVRKTRDDSRESLHDRRARIIPLAEITARAEIARGRRVGRRRLRARDESTERLRVAEGRSATRAHVPERHRRASERVGDAHGGEEVSRHAAGSRAPRRRLSQP